MNLSFSKAHRYYMYAKAADMRKGCDGLSGLVQREFLLNPLNGDIFIFLNHRRNLIKLLHWQGERLKFHLHPFFSLFQTLNEEL